MIDKETRWSRAVLIMRKHPEVDCLIEAYQHIHEREWGDADTPDVTVPPHARE